jgi:hypothetical protein
MADMSVEARQTRAAIARLSAELRIAAVRSDAPN